MTFSAASIIETKRYDLRPHTEDELKWWIKSYCEGSIPDYQMSAWLMAVCWRGMTLEETGLLTKCMVQSGTQLHWSVPEVLSSSMVIPKVDKHSAGGVGDKISIVLAPLVACAGIQVPMMAGRGLGHTGGTLDKLESIPGFQVDQTEENFQRIVRDIGCSICVDHATNGPGRSKTIAENPDSLVLDVKYGRGSFQATVEAAHELAISLIHTAEMNGLNPTTALLTRMDIPIGRGIGNWLEITECLDMMRGCETKDPVTNLKQLVLCEAAQMLIQSGIRENVSLEDIVKELKGLLESGVVLRKFRDMVEAQGGDVSTIENPENYPSAPFQCSIVAPKDGFVSDMDALVMGHAAVALGAGRQVASDDVDALAGLWLNKVVGEAVKKGDTVVALHTSRSEDVLQGVKALLEEAIVYSDKPPSLPVSISHVVTRDGMKEFSMPISLI